MSKKISSNDIYDFLSVLRQRQNDLEGTTFEVDYRLLADDVERVIKETRKWRDARDKALATGKTKYAA